MSTMGMVCAQTLCAVERIALAMRLFEKGLGISHA